MDNVFFIIYFYLLCNSLQVVTQLHDTFAHNFLSVVARVNIKKKMDVNKQHNSCNEKVV